MMLCTSAQSVFLVWTLHGRSEINKRPVGMGTQNKEQLSASFLASHQQDEEESKRNSEWSRFQHEELSSYNIVVKSRVFPLFMHTN